MKCLRVLAAALLVLACAPAFAQLYLFAGAGGGNPKFNNNDFPLGSFRRDDTKDVTYHVGVGYRLSSHWAVELGAADLGDYSLHREDFLGNSFTGTYKVQGIKTAVLGSYPLTERFSVFGKLGLASTKAEFEGNLTIGGTPTLFSGDERRNSLLAGFGAQYNLTSHIGIRAEYENWGDVGNENDTGRAKMHTWNLLGVFTF